jgi:hypothetical protein
VGKKLGMSCSQKKKKKGYYLLRCNAWVKYTCLEENNKSYLAGFVFEEWVSYIKVNLMQDKLTLGALGLPGGVLRIRICLAPSEQSQW